MCGTTKFSTMDITRRTILCISRALRGTTLLTHPCISLHNSLNFQRHGITIHEKRTFSVSTEHSHSITADVEEHDDITENINTVHQYRKCSIPEANEIANEILSRLEQGEYRTLDDFRNVSKTLVSLIANTRPLQNVSIRLLSTMIRQKIVDYESYNNLAFSFIFNSSIITQRSFLYFIADALHDPETVKYGNLQELNLTISRAFSENDISFHPEHVEKLLAIIASRGKMDDRGRHMPLFKLINMIQKKGISLSTKCHDYALTDLAEVNASSTEAYFNKMKQHDLVTANSYHSMTDYYYRISEPEKAGKMIEECLSKFPNEFTVASMMLRRALFHKNLPHALGIIKAVRSAPEYTSQIEKMIEFGYLRMLLVIKTEDAIKFLDQVLQNVENGVGLPTHPDHYYLLQRLYAKNGLECLLNYLKRLPNTQDPLSTLTKGYIVDNYFVSVVDAYFCLSKEDAKVFINHAINKFSIPIQTLESLDTKDESPPVSQLLAPFDIGLASWVKYGEDNNILRGRVFYRSLMMGLVKQKAVESTLGLFDYAMKHDNTMIYMICRNAFKSIFYFLVGLHDWKRLSELIIFATETQSRIRKVNEICRQDAAYRLILRYSALEKILSKYHIHPGYITLDKIASNSEDLKALEILKGEGIETVGELRSRSNMEKCYSLLPLQTAERLIQSISFPDELVDLLRDVGLSTNPIVQQRSNIDIQAISKEDLNEESS